MAIIKETSFWGKWTRRKTLEPQTTVSLDSPLQAAAYSMPPLFREDVFVSSDESVRRLIVDPLRRQMLGQVLSGGKINDAGLERNSVLSRVGIKTRIVYEKGENQEKRS